MHKTLIVAYSLTGTTRAASRSLQRMIDADLIEIRDARPRRGFLGIMRSIWEVFSGASPAIETDRHDLSDYALVILAGPVWAYRPASPLFAYVRDHRQTLPRIAVLLTLGGSGSQSAVNHLSTVASRAPAATVALSDEDRRSGATETKLLEFAETLRRSGATVGPAGGARAAE